MRQMKSAKLAGPYLLALAIPLLCGPAVGLGDPPGACASGVPGTGYGDGSSGSWVVPSGTHILPPDMNYEDVTVSTGATLDTRGRVLRVCGTLTVISGGTIKDLGSGGTGGPGGAGGDGGRGCLPHHYATDGQCPTQGGQAGTCPGAGRGGDGGCGGGGGGGAWNTTVPCTDNCTPGGDGGDGAAGGRGGGCVTIWAYVVDNQGTIQADGSPGSSGQAGQNGLYDDYVCWLVSRDQCSGGGGGGGGGDGGDGGTVELHTTTSDGVGNLHANGGAGGGGGGRGTQPSPCPLEYPYGPGQHYEEGASGPGGGGDGGESDIGVTCSNNAGPGQNGDAGTPGRVRLICAGTDVEHYDLNLTINPSTRIIDGRNIMSVRCLRAVDTFTFRLDMQLDTTPEVWVRDDPEAPWTPVPYEWLSDEVTVLVQLDRPYEASELFDLRVDYSGQPRTRPENGLGGGQGMHFEEHGPDEVPIVFTTVEPWYAYLWWPVKDDGDNWNCDKATADLTFTVPDYMKAVSNGLLQELIVSPPWASYHWHTDYQTAAYLFCMAATSYHHESLTYDGMPVDLYPWPEAEGELLPVYLPEKLAKWGRVVGMLALYEDRYGPYPFAAEKYAIYQWPEGHGAMEHQTATGQPGKWRDFISDSPPFFASEWQTSHELAHSWWGDEVTCATWNDIWLNEGFASYSESVWIENQFNRNEFPFTLPRASDALSLLKWYQSWVHRAWRILDEPAFDESVYVYDVSDPANVLNYWVEYKKATWPLHMLRHLTDPEYQAPDDPNHCHTPLFFELLQAYRVAQASSGCTSTPEFQAAAEQVLESHGVWDSWPPQYRNLAWFFNEWVYNGGAPGYYYRRLLASPPGHFRFRIRQVQPTLFGDPLFTMPIDIDIHTVGGQTERHVVWNDAAAQDYDIAVGPGLQWMSFDSDDWILKRFLVPEIPGLLTNVDQVSTVLDPVAAINNLAQVAGTSGTASDSEQALLWLVEPYYDLTAGQHTLGTLGGTWSRAYDINDAGQIVGQSEDSGGDKRAFLWVPETGYGLQPRVMHSLPSNDGPAAAYGINGLGQVVGYSGPSDENYQAALWQYDAASEVWELIILPGLGGAKSLAWGINNAGQAAGWAESGDGQTHAVVWEYSPDGDNWTVTELQLPCTTCFAYGINDSGDIVGQADGQPMLWRRVEAPIGPPPEPPYDPIPLPGGLGRVAGIAYEINDAGMIVGELDGRACLWQTPNADPMDLTDTYVPSSCWTLNAAWDINDAGQIVGYGSKYDQSRVFVLDPLGTSDCNTNGVLDACETCSPSGVRSCADHDSAGRLCLDMGASGGIDPRMCAIAELEIDLAAGCLFNGGVTVDCSTPWNGWVEAWADGNVVTLGFEPALPDQAYCTVTLDCGAEVCVRGLKGDIDRGGVVTPADASIIKPQFTKTPVSTQESYGPTQAECRFDYDCSGLITPGDFSQTKPKFTHTAPECGQPYVETYGDSGCLSGARGTTPSDLRGCADDDQVVLTVEGNTLHVLHRNATYNCCRDDIAVSLVVEGPLLILTEEEIVTIPCFCVCCYDVEATVVDLAPGEYTVEYRWYDYETQGERFYVETIVVP